jgi:very-short-patch-repair endonuclease
VWRVLLGDGLVLATHGDTPSRRVQAGGLTWPRAVAAYTTAAVFHGLPVADDGLFHGLFDEARPRPRPRMVPHQVPVDVQDVLVVGAGAVTTIERTVLDCIGRLDMEAADRLVAWATTREVLTTEVLELAIAARPRRWGTRALRRALTDVERGTLSAAERRLHRLLDKAGLRGWEADVRVEDARGHIGRVDVLFPAVKVAVEVDGYAYHSRSSFQADRTKQNRLVAAGYTVLRFTWSDLTDRPHQVVASVRQAIAGRVL